MATITLGPTGAPRHKARLSTTGYPNRIELKAKLPKKMTDDPVVIKMTRDEALDTAIEILKQLRTRPKPKAKKVHIRKKTSN